MKFFFAAIVTLFLITPELKAQDSTVFTDENVLYQDIVDGDTILISHIEEVHIYRKPKFKSKREWRRYYKLVRNVKRVYPFVKMAGRKYKEVEGRIENMGTEKEKRKYIKKVENQIIEEYEDDLKKLTITQGRILLKLIDREVGETSYDLLKDFKGSFNAFFWQTLARIFGHNLKSEFDPEGEDKLLNDIVLMIEAGQI